jgi:tight adherence protein B
MDQGLERMHERVPLPEVNFLAIAIAIQKETGGNLSEALENLSIVLRARKAMKLKIKAITQEAKVSAFIIGALPFVLIGGISFLNPGHLDPFFNTQSGQLTAILSFTWMLIGVLLMRKLINFKF